MRILTLLLIPFIILGCQQDTLEEYFVPLENCDYLPSPCSLISIDQYIDISGTTPAPTADDYTIMPSSDAETRVCEFSFEDGLGNNYMVNTVLKCVRNIETSDFITDLSQATTYADNYTFESEHSFSNAIYFPDVDVYVIRKDNYVMEIDFQEFTKDQQLEIANIILNNLP